MSVPTGNNHDRSQQCHRLVRADSTGRVLISPLHQAAHVLSDAPVTGHRPWQTVVVDRLANLMVDGLHPGFGEDDAGERVRPRHGGMSAGRGRRVPVGDFDRSGTTGVPQLPGGVFEPQLKVCRVPIFLSWADLLLCPHDDPSPGSFLLVREVKWSQFVALAVIVSTWREEADVVSHAGTVGRKP